MKPIAHRVERKRQPIPPPLPKEVVPLGAREYVDRWGNEMVVIWNGQPGDPDLRDLHTRPSK